MASAGRCAITCARPCLRGLGPEGLSRLRALNPAIRSPEQALVDRWLSEEDEKLACYDVEQLAVLSRVGTWFETTPGHLPGPASLTRLRGLATVREPLLMAPGFEFHGRKQELQALAAFAAKPPGDAPAVLVVFGIGGSGKSTLTARFLLQVLDGDDASNAIAYIDFDRPTVDVADGMTIMIELARQLAAQHPDVAAMDAIASRAEQAMVELAVGRGRAPGRAHAVRAAAAELAGDSGVALRAAGVTRVTVVFDTFEEAQYANADHQRQLEEQLAMLHASLPGLHTIVVSRARLQVRGASLLEVGDLDDEAARAFVVGCGIEDAALVDSALAVARGNPLSLKLVTSLLKKGGVASVGDLAAQRDALEQGLVQGQLYQRILRHIHQPQIQRLAHPGLVVRRVTPEIVREVLAVPCGLGDLDGRRRAPHLRAAGPRSLAGHAGARRRARAPPRRAPRDARPALPRPTRAGPRHPRARRAVLPRPGW